MTGAAPALRLVGPEDVVLERLRQRLDLDLLVGRGWNPEINVFAPAPDDPLFGYHLCERAGCTRGGSSARARERRLCEYCSANFVQRRTNLGALGQDFTVEEYRATPFQRHVDASSTSELCIVCCVSGFERPAKRSGLCQQCADAAKRLSLTPEEYRDGGVGRGPAKPRRTFGMCLVQGCSRHADNTQGLCRTCKNRWYRRYGKLFGRSPEGFEEFLRAGPWEPAHDGRTAELKVLSPLVELQLLHGLQAMIQPLGVSMPVDRLSMAWASVARSAIETIHAFPEPENRGSYSVRRIVEIAQSVSLTMASTPEEERQKPVWRLAVFGHGVRATLSFETIHQDWLVEIAKSWVVKRLAELKTAAPLSPEIAAIELLSDYLRTRPDRGDLPAALTRQDITEFLVWQRRRGLGDTLRRQQSALVRIFSHARRQLRGENEPGGRLGATFHFYPDDVDRAPARDPEEPGKAVPSFVLAQLLDPDALQALADNFVEYSAIFEIQADVGRRPVEITGLRFDCIRWEEASDATGERTRRPVLRYLREKRPKKWLSLPIHLETAERIEKQQQRTRRRYPNTPEKRLPLFPRKTANPKGIQPVAPPTMAHAINKWLSARPPLIDEEGSEFPQSDVYLYALRHSFAQRHADHHVQLDVLQVLMDHQSPQTTQVYYRVSRERRREAIEGVAPLTIDSAGRRVSLQQELTESEDLRRQIGRIPVPLGYCIEQHNVKALGSHCPFSHQCLGCGHFRSDPSFLPDLYAYLERLLETRARLRATVPQLAEWAREKAIPNDSEVLAVRNLIRSNEELLAELADDERRKIEELCRVLRTQRAKMDNTISVEIVGAVAQPQVTFHPMVPPAATSENGRPV